VPSQPAEPQTFKTCDSAPLHLSHQQHMPLYYLRHLRSRAASAHGSASKSFQTTCFCGVDGFGAAAARAAWWFGVGVGSLIMAVFFVAVVSLLFNLLSCCSSIPYAQLFRNAIYAVVHAGAHAVVGIVFGRRFVVPLCIFALVCPHAGAMDTGSFGTPVPPDSAGLTTLVAGAAAFAAAQGMPMSVSPQRTDPRPPTCASVGRDIASIVQRLSQGRADVSRAILEQTRAFLDSDGAGEHWPTPEPECCEPRDHPDKAVRTAALVLSSLHSYVTGPLASTGGGTRHRDSQKALDTIAAAVHSEELVEQRLQSEARRQTGLSVAMQAVGANLRGNNDVAPAAAVAVGIPRKVYANKVDLEFIYEWFHTDSPDVEPDKTTKFSYKRKRCFCAGKQRDLKCARKVMTCSVAEAVQHCMESDVFRNSRVSLHEKNVAACICPCIKPAKRHECVCPICNEFVEALTAYNRARYHWHATDDPKCQGGCGLDCKNLDSEFRAFTKNHSTFEVTRARARAGRDSKCSNISSCVSPPSTTSHATLGSNSLQKRGARGAGTAARSNTFS
jgi:hypothetical protein